MLSDHAERLNRLCNYVVALLLLNPASKKEPDTGHQLNYFSWAPRYVPNGVVSCIHCR